MPSNQQTQNNQRLQSSQRLPSSERLPSRQEVPPNIKEHVVSFEDLFTRPVDSCAQLNQLQSIVLQLLSTHHSASDAISVLTTACSSLQDDISSLKARLDLVDTTCSSLETQMAEMASHDNNRTQPPAVTSDDDRANQNRLNVSQMLAPYVSKLDTYGRQHSNFSKRMTQQTKSLQSLERQHKRLRRMLVQIEQNMRTVEAAQRNASDVTAIMTQFTDKLVAHV